MLLAVHRGDNLALAGALALMVEAAVQHRDAMTERPSDEPLQRAVGLL